MHRRTWLVLALLLLCLGGGLLFSRVIGPRLQDAGLLAASDAARIKGTISVAGDNYLGYWFLTSREFNQRLRQRGYALKWTSDGGNYAERHKNFAEGRYDAMVLPVSSYLYHGLAYRYPGVIPVAISDSKGADAIVGYVDQVAPNAGRAPTVNDLNNSNLRICVTPDSPSEFLLNVAIAHFALDELKKNGAWTVATKGSEDAYRKLRNRECHAAVLWEPDVSKALALPGVAQFFGSDQVSEMIVDVFVLRRQLIQDDPELVDAFFTTYFETLAHYSNNRQQLASDVAKEPAFESPEAAQRAAARVSWFGSEANCQEWFNVGLPGVAAPSRTERIIDVISQVSEVMIRVGDVASDPLGGNPYSITNSEVLRRTCSHFGAAPGIGVQPAAYRFGPIPDEEWTRLRTIGRIRIVPISFDPSTATLTRDGVAVLEQVATALANNYPQYRVLVRGHTAPSGNEQANVALSQERADAVKAQLVAGYGLDPNRLHAVGLGAAEPLPRQPSEGELSYRNRLPRVEFVLVENRS